MQATYKVTVSVKDTVELTYDLYYVITPDDLDFCCDWLEAQPDFLLDTETSGLSPWKDRLATVQVGNPFLPEPIAFVVDIRMFTTEQLQRFYGLVSSSKRQKLGQNIKFEYRFLNVQAGVDIENLWDTQIAEMVIRAGLFPETKAETEDGEDKSQAYSHTSMGALYERYFGITLDKDHDVRTSFYRTPPGTHSRRQLVYAAGDVIYPAYIKQEQEKEIEARALKSIIAIEMAAIRVTARAEVRGIPIDKPAWRALAQEASHKRKDAQQKLHALLLNVQQRELFNPGSGDRVLYPKTGEAVNFDSTKQLQWAVKSYCESIGWSHRIVTEKKELEALRRRYGKNWLDKRYDNQSGKKMLWDFMGDNLDFVPDYLIPEDQYCLLVKTDKDTLKMARLKEQLPRQIVDLLLEYGKHSTREDNFGNEFLVKHVADDGRIHTEFHQVKTSTGRYSTTPNLQNIPIDSRYRKCFIPTKGYKFVIADYSQQEPRLTAQESMDPVYLATYQNDEDIYINVAEAMLGYRPDPESADEEFRTRSKRDRQIMKQVVLAMAYRMGVAKLHRKLLLALEEEILAGRMDAPTYEYVKGLHEKFLATFTKLVEYQNYCSNSASHSGKAPRVIWDRYRNVPITWATARCGRKRFFTPDAEGVYTAAANSPIQGCAATMSKAAAVMIQGYIDKHNIDAGVVDMVHDELVYECREDQAEKFALVVKYMMEKAGKFYLPDVPIKADFPKNTNGTLDYWAKEVKLEQAA